MTPASERCIECEEIQLARVSDLRPSQTLPLPASALEGEAAGSSLTRRALLGAGVAGFASVYGSRMLGFEEIFEAAVAEAATPGPNNCLVLLYLAGGNDALNTVVPGPGLNAGADHANYAGVRSAIHRGHGATAGGRVGSQPIAGTGSQLSWANTVVSTGGGGDNGSSGGFDTLFGPGDGGAGSDLAFMPGVDYQPYSMSHFDSSDYWFSGALSPLQTGWLGRWIDRNGSARNPLQAVSIDTALSKAIRTATNPVCAIPSTSALGFSMATAGVALPPGSNPTANITNVMRTLSGESATAGNTYLERSRRTYGMATDVAGSAATLNAAANATAPYPSTGSLSTKLRLAAKILGAGLGTRIITIHWGSFDTHGSQIAGQDPQLRELSAALAAFQADLQARGVEQQVTTLAFSEFGRRVAENGSAGTDHGAGGLMLASGSAVRGGWASPFPGCRAADLDSVGNLKIPTDYRSVFQAVLEEWLGGDTDGVLPGGAFPSLVRADGAGTLFR